MPDFNWDYQAERDLWRGICAPNSWHGESERGRSLAITHPESLYWFILKCWGVQSFLRSHPEQPRWFQDRVHKPFITWLQTHILRWKALSYSGCSDRYYIGVVIPRGFGKTICATKSASLWMHLDEPDMSTMLYSATSELAVDILGGISSVMSGKNQDSWFTWLYGNWKTGAKDWNKRFITHGYRRVDNLSESSFDSTAMDIGLTGYHPRVCFIDDPIIGNKLREGGVYMTAVHQGVDAIYNALQTNGLMVLVLTRYLDDDVAGRHFQEEGIATWTGMEMPSVAFTQKIDVGHGTWHVYFLQSQNEQMAEDDPLSYTLPEVYDMKKFKEGKRRNPEDTACQQQNNPGTSDRSPLIEAQIPDLFISYEDFQFQVPIGFTTVHLDTAFKRPENIGKGDDNAIVTWHHDERSNGVMYLDSDLLRASNEWREEDFNDVLIKDVLMSLRKQGRWIRHLTDEVEPGGKAGSYSSRLKALIRSSGIMVSKIHILNRTSQKKARIRTSAGHWAEGYVRILLHKDPRCRCVPTVDQATGHISSAACPHWIIPKTLQKLLYQITRVDTAPHDDLADAQADAFIDDIWQKPIGNIPAPIEGVTPSSPGDEFLKSLSRPMTNEELFGLMDSQAAGRAYEEASTEASYLGPGHGPDDDFLPPRDPV
jgi:hypothetical protein